MGKQGPCYHCGVTSTPLWRNGPADKPVLCNACGSRWRTKGTLANYTPLHARAESDDCEDQRVSRVKSISINKNQEVKLLKRKHNHENILPGGIAPDYNLGYRKFVDEDTSNRSSSGSAISNSDSYAQIGSTDACDFTGPAQSVVWDAMVPSKKRTCVGRPKQSAVEKLTKDLCTILHEQQSYFSGSSEDDLLFESETPLVSVEIGHGTVLIRHPSSIAREEESEASSLSVDKHGQMSEAYSYVDAIAEHTENKGVKFPTYEFEKIRNASDGWMQQEQHKRDKSQLERVQILGNRNSPLQSIDLNDIVNYEEFMKHLTREEQQQLLKYLPLADTVKLPESLKNMFGSTQFKENLAYFQHLLAEGVWDVSLVGAQSEDCRTLKGLALTNLSKSKWVGHYNSLKSCKNSTLKSVVQESPATASSNVISVKRSRDGQNHSFAEGRTSLKSPKRAMMKPNAEGKEVLEDGSLFSPRSLFAMPADGSTLMLDSFSIVEESSDQDLLLEVPSNGSFPEAELLHPSLSLGARASTSSSSVYPHLVLP